VTESRLTAPPPGDEPVAAPISVAVIGSREYPRLDLVEKFVASLPRGTRVVSGGAPGVDATAEAMWRALGGDVLSIEAEWALLGNTAGIARNRMTVMESTRLYAFWDTVSHGTANTICRAANASTLRWIAGPDGRRDTARLLEAAWAIERPKHRMSRTWDSAVYATERILAASHLSAEGLSNTMDSGPEYRGPFPVASQSGVRA
jgi:hypothetical protein